MMNPLSFMVDLSRPCDACGKYIGGGFHCCLKCKIYFCFYCTLKLPTPSNTIKKKCPMCGGKFE
jgi:hypothetical protein